MNKQAGAAVVAVVAAGLFNEKHTRVDQRLDKQGYAFLLARTRGSG